MNDSYKQKNQYGKENLSGTEERKIQVRLGLVLGLSLISPCYKAPCSLFYMQNYQLTETKLRGFDKWTDELSISVKISEITLMLAEKLTPFSAGMCSFTLSSLPGMEDRLDMRA